MDEVDEGFNRAMLEALATTNTDELRRALENLTTVRNQLKLLSFGDSMDLASRLAMVLSTLRLNNSVDNLQLIDVARSLLVTLLGQSNGALARAVPDVLEGLLDALDLTKTSQHSIPSHMHLILFTTLVIAVEFVDLPKTDPLWHRLDTVLNPIFLSVSNDTGKAASSGASDTPATCWPSLDDSQDVAMVRDIQKFLSTSVSATLTPLEAQFYTIAHWAAFLTGLCLAVVSVFLVANRTSVIVVGTCLLTYGSHSLTQSHQRSRRRHSLLRRVVQRCEFPYAGANWCTPAAPVPKPTETIPKREATPSTPGLQTLARRQGPLAAIDEEDPEPKQPPAIDSSILAQLNPAEMLETLQKLQTLLADDADVSAETREKVQRGLQVLQHMGPTPALTDE